MNTDLVYWWKQITPSNGFVVGIYSLSLSKTQFSHLLAALARDNEFYRKQAYINNWEALKITYGDEVLYIFE